MNDETATAQQPVEAAQDITRQRITTTMNDDINAKLENERAKGDEYRRVWDNMVGPFFIRKDEELFQAFKMIDSSDIKKLSEVRMHAQALESLKAEFEHFINTGQMASQMLNDQEKENG